jgi:hypothetical protein
VQKAVLGPHPYTISVDGNVTGLAGMESLEDCLGLEAVGVDANQALG